MKLFRSTLVKLILTTLLLLVFVVVSGNSSWGSNLLGTPAKIIMSPFQASSSWVASKFGGLGTYFGDNAKLHAENILLHDQVNNLKTQVGDIDELIEQNKNLRDVVKLKSDFEKFNMVGGNIIAKESGNWFNTFTIDVGSADGVKIDDPVITGVGLVGRIANVSNGSSVVVSIIDPYSKISAINVRTRQLVVSVRGDINLTRKLKCRLEFVDEDIEKGDMVETSGISGIYPRGLSIGTISEIFQAGNELDTYAIIDPIVDFNKLREVFVYTQKKK